MNPTSPFSAGPPILEWKPGLPARRQAGKKSGPGPLLTEWRTRPGAYAAAGLWALAATFAAALLLDQRSLLHRVVDQEASEIVWAVFLDDKAEKDRLERFLRSLPGIRSIRFISKEEAYGAVLADPELAPSLALAGRNPFPETFEVRWEPSALHSRDLKEATALVRAHDGVERVDYDAARVARLDVLQRLFHEADFVLLGLVLAAAVLAAALSARLLFFSGRGYSARRFAVCLAAGLAGGVLGAGLAENAASIFSWHVLWVGPAAGFLCALYLSLFA
ncbi:MAG: cell division protein FtsX [Elusimicrobiota bacterium]